MSSTETREIPLGLTKNYSIQHFVDFFSTIFARDLSIPVFIGNMEDLLQDSPGDFEIHQLSPKDSFAKSAVQDYLEGLNNLKQYREDYSCSLIISEIPSLACQSRFPFFSADVFHTKRGLVSHLCLSYSSKNPKNYDVFVYI